VIWRSYCEVTYFTCNRCQQKWPLSQAGWDSGLLVCRPRCKDRDINGSFEYAESREASRDTHELEPDVKLYNPTDVLQQIEHVSARCGLY